MVSLKNSKNIPKFFSVLVLCTQEIYDVCGVTLSVLSTLRPQCKSNL